jgi:hypothetical protein
VAESALRFRLDLVQQAWESEEHHAIGGSGRDSGEPVRDDVVADNLPRTDAELLLDGETLVLVEDAGDGCAVSHRGEHSLATR